MVSKVIVWLAVFTAFVLITKIGPARAGDEEVLKELQLLKQRVFELETKLKEKEAIEVKASSQVGPAGEGQGLQSSSNEVEAAEGASRETPQEEKKEYAAETAKGIMEKLGTLSIHGNVVGYYQGASDTTIAGQHFANPDGVGYAADLKLDFEPIKNGEFVLRLHAGEGEGADKYLDEAGALFANLNTIKDDNPGDSTFDLLDVFYMQGLFDNRVFLTIGKTEPFSFIDNNEYANNEVSQFVGKPFVNDPVFDSEDEFAPLFAVSYLPSERFSLVALVQSSSFPSLEEEMQKDKYEDIFERPLFAGQLTYSPVINKLKGNYRLYGWVQTYDHPTLGGDDTEKGWGVGLSCDQQLNEKVGLFGRLGYHNEDVYEVPWFWSIGTNLKGIIPSRAEDEIGCGLAGLKANQDLRDDDSEFHVETYYRIVLSEYFALTGDLQYVANPRGDPGSDDVWAGMVRGEFSF